MKTLATITISLVLNIVNCFSQGTWTQVASFPDTGLYTAVVFADTIYGYVVGGNHFSGQISGALFRYDPINNLWIPKASMPVGTSSSCGFHISGKGYLTTGESTWGLFTELDVYNPIADNWALKSSFMGPGRVGSASFSIGNHGFVSCGRDASIPCNYNDFWSYEKVNDTWILKPVLPAVERTGAVGFTLNGKGYIFGGNGNNSYLSELWEYDTLSETWIDKQSLPASGRAKSSAFVLNDRAYVVGGNDAASAYDECWEYDPVTDNWTQMADFPGGARYSGVAFSIGGTGYFGTGLNGSASCNDFWSFTPPVIGLNELNDRRISLFPNPNTGDFTLELPIGENEKMNVDIYDIAGRIVCKRHVFSEINVGLTVKVDTDLSPGSYLIRVTGSKQNYLSKLIIK